MKSCRSGRVVSLALCCLALCAGCARLSVAHLETRPLAVGTDGQVGMQYFRFTYGIRLDGGAYAVRGQAWPVMFFDIHQLRRFYYCWLTCATVHCTSSVG